MPVNKPIMIDNQARLKHGDVVLVIGTDSLLTTLLGSYGVVTNPHGGNGKVVVEFKARVEGSKHGSLSHTARPSDLQKIGEADAWKNV